ncbi:MAG: DegV family protein [Acidimicrobiales bacterium]
MIGLVTDSNSQIPPDLARELAVEVVPLTVTIDGVDHTEDEDLDADGFWAFFDGATPTVTTSQPSPGRFAETYAALARQGVEEILSVHIGSELSGTVGSARLAAASAPVPVHVVDTGTASFAVTCCVWEAALALAAGASVDEATAAAEAVAATVGMVFVVKALELAHAGGRLVSDARDSVLELGPGAVPVLTLMGGAMEVVGQVAEVADAADVMADCVRTAGTAGTAGIALRVGVGVADAATAALGRALEDRLRVIEGVLDVVRYRVGPSVGAHTGPGTVGAVWYPTGVTGTLSPTGRR